MLHKTYTVVTGIFPRKVPPMKSMHGNNVVWLCPKYAVDVNLFPLKSPILTRAKRATSRNNVRGEYTGVERSAGNFPGGSIPRTYPSVLDFRYEDQWNVSTQRNIFFPEQDIFKISNIYLLIFSQYIFFSK